MLFRSVGPFPSTFQRISSGFLPDPLGGESLRLLSLGLAAAVAALLVATEWRKRVKQLGQGMDPEPVAFFVVRTGAFAAAMLYVGWLLSTYKGLPNVLVLMAVLIVLYQFVTNHTTVGRRIYALGGNEKAARLSGIRTERLAFLTFVNMGVLAALAGLVFAARLNTATPKIGRAHV